MSDFYKMADELRLLLRDLFPNGVYVQSQHSDDGISIVIKNYNSYSVYIEVKG